MIANVMGHLNCSGAAASSSSSSWGIAKAGGQCVACASFSRLPSAPAQTLFTWPSSGNPTEATPLEFQAH